MTKKQFNKQVGSLIKEQRIKYNISQTYLANKLRLNQSAISRIESGKQELSAYEYYIISKIMSS